MIAALEKHRKKLLKYAAAYASYENTDYISEKQGKLFMRLHSIIVAYLTLLTFKKQLSRQL